MSSKDTIQTIGFNKVEYSAFIDISKDLIELAVFIKPNFRDHVKFNTEYREKIAEFPITLLWNMLRSNLASANFPKDKPELLRRQEEAKAAERYLEEYEKMIKIG